jgi:hypothetical protein
MRLCGLLLCGLLAHHAAAAATMDEAASLFDARKFAEAAKAYEQVIAREPQNSLAHIRLARARAALGDDAAALAAIQNWIAAGNASYLTAMAAPEFATLRNDQRFTALVDPLRPCSTSEFRQFDFWIGDWDVQTAGPQASPGVLTHNRITSINGGCSLLEEYQTPAGFEGKSLNFFDASRKIWHQTWIDNQGQPVFLEGGLRGNAMVMSTPGVESAGSASQPFSRVTWTPLEDGRVRQHWVSTQDGGRTWTTVFDGYYSRRKSP